jgi:hypothetical protein
MHGVRLDRRITVNKITTSRPEAEGSGERREAV